MATTNYCLRLAYDGRNFCGYQIQTEERTVQGEMETVLSLLFKEEIRIHASGRTDTGVHALGQVVSFKAEPLLQEERLLYALNRLLPEDIQVLEVKQVEDEFHPRYDALAKVYRYRFTRKKDVFLRPYRLYLEKEIDLAKIKQAAGLLEGKKDFFNFSNRRKEEGSTLRQIYRIAIEKTEEGFDLVFVGDGFLYKMVRIMVAYLLEVGYGRISPEMTQGILEERDRRYTRKVAPAQGLYLEKVFYDEEERTAYLTALKNSEINL